MTPPPALPPALRAELVALAARVEQTLAAPAVPRLDPEALAGVLAEVMTPTPAPTPARPAARKGTRKPDPETVRLGRRVAAMRRKERSWKEISLELGESIDKCRNAFRRRGVVR